MSVEVVSLVVVMIVGVFMVWAHSHDNDDDIGGAV